MPFDDQGAISDDALLRRYADGDAAAARMLTARLLPRVLAQAHAMLRNRADAEDVAQEAMLRLWRMAPDWRPGEARISTWLYRVTANLCIDRMRRDRSVGLDEAPEPEDPAAGPAQGLQDRARAAALRAALMTLPERQREAVELRHLRELGNPEIAGIMGVSVEAVESLLARAKRALVAELSARREELGYADD